MKGDSEIITRRGDHLVMALVIVACIAFMVVVGRDLMRVERELNVLQAKLDEIAGNVGIYVGDNEYASEESHDVGIYIGEGWDCAIETKEHGCMMVDDKGYVMFVPIERFPTVAIAKEKP